MATTAGSGSPTRPITVPDGIPCKPPPEKFEEPVAWLFGRQFIASLKYILLYTAFKGKLDARDWMKAGVIPDCDSPAAIEQFWGEETGAAEEAGDSNPESKNEFWFDYISDTGDGQKAMYSIAYLCMSDLGVGKKPRRNEPVDIQPDEAKLAAEGKMLLPRGTFLFVGGDTSYHISDYATLGKRFQNPFWWAFEDLYKSAKGAICTAPRLLFGIPGNHDYYDSLDGFNRQFRRPSSGDEVVEGKRLPMLMLPTFRRSQEASYVALRLPFDWWFWGLDTEDGEIDFRQLEFFRNLNETHKPAKLIVATPEPTTAFGKFADEEENQSKTFQALGLERPFLRNGEPLGDGKCRVDLSGDIHHYARYWGPPPPPLASEGKDEDEDSDNYASVMAGGGGAFFHPSQTNVHEVPQRLLYPPEDESRHETANQLFKFRNIVKGGFVWLFGFLIAFGLFFAAYFPQSARDSVDSFPPFVRLGISPPVEAQNPDPPVAYVKPMIRYTWGPNAPQKPASYFLWIVSLVVSLGALAAALIYSAKIFKKKYDPEKDYVNVEATKKESVPLEKRCDPEYESARVEATKKSSVPIRKRLIVWGLVFIAFVTLAFGILGFQSYEIFLTRYSRSLLIFAALLWAVLAVIESIRYSGWLFEESYKVNIRTWHYWPVWVLLIMAVVELIAALWFFGKHESAYLIADLAQLIILLAVGGGLIYFAVGTGAGLKKGAGKVGFLLLGISHALLQLAVPFLLVRKGHLLWAPLAALVLIVVFKYIGRSLARLKNGWLLAIAWVVYGAALLSIPFVLHAAFLDPNASNLNIPESRWVTFLLCLYAGVIGAIMSCALFGWYLAVSLAFNGHNNEAGGAARIEGFKQLIRFRLNGDGLTGYVIGVKKAAGVAEELKPQVVDVFRICERKRPV